MVQTVCLCFSSGMCSEYVVLAIVGLFERDKQEINALLMPPFCCQDAVTNPTANKTLLLHLTVSQPKWLGLYWRYGFDYFISLVCSADVSIFTANMHDCHDNGKVYDTFLFLFLLIIWLIYSLMH